MPDPDAGLTPGPPPPLPRGRRTRRWIVLAVLLAAAAAAALALRGWQGRLEERLRVEAEARVSALVGGTLRIGGLRLSLAPPGFEARDVRLEIPAPGAPPLRVEAGRAFVRIPWRGVAGFPGGAVRLGVVELESPRVEMSEAWMQAHRTDGPETPPREIRIDRLAVRDGVFRYDDGSIPMTFEARDLAVRGDWSDWRHALVAEVSAATTLARPEFTRPLPVTLRAAIRLRAGRVEIPQLTARAPGAVIHGRGHVLFEHPTRVRLETSLEGDLAEIGPWLADLPEASGRVRGRLVVDVLGTEWRVHGPVEAERARLGSSLAVLRTTATLDLVRGRADLREVAASAYGGTLAGTVALDFRGGLRFRADLDGRGLDAREVLDLAGLQLPFAARVHAGVLLEGDPGDPATWSGGGTVRADPDPAAARARGHLPLGATGRFTLREGLLAVGPAQVETGGASLALDLAADLGTSPVRGALRLEGTTRDAGQTLAGTERILESLDTELPEIARRPLEGAGALSARLGLGGPPDADLHVDLAPAVWAGHAFDRARITARIRADLVALDEIALEGPEGRLRAGLALDGAGELLSLEATLEGVPSGLVRQVVPLPDLLDGRITGDLGLARAPDGLRGSGAVRMEDLAPYGERIDRIDARVTVEAGTAVLRDLTFEGPAVHGAGEVRVALETGVAEIDLVRGEVFPGGLEALASRGVALSGSLEVSGALRVDEEGPHGEILLRGRPESAGVAADLAGQLELTPEALLVDVTGEGGIRWRLHGTLGWGEDLPLDLALRTEDALIELAAAGGPPVVLGLTGDLRLGGPLARPEELRGEGRIAAATVQAGSLVLETAEPVPIALEAGSLSVGPLRLQGEGSSFQGSFRYAMEGGAVEGSARGTLDLALLAALAPDIRGSGPLEVDLAVSGTAEAPQVTGTLAATDGRVRIAGFAQSLDQVRLRAELTGSRVELREASARLGGGEIRMSGTLALEGFAPGEFAFRAAGRNLRLAYPEGFVGIYEGDLAFSGRPEGATLGGQVRMVRGQYTREFDLAALLGTGTREYGDEVLLPDTVALDVDFVSEGNVWVRNELAELESRFDLHLGGTLARPEVTGRAWILEEGKITYQDVEYRIRQGSLDFVEVDRLEPYIDLTAETWTSGYEITLRVQGRVDRLEYELTSSPSLSQEDIVSLLVTGSTLEDLTAAGGSGAGAISTDMAANYFAGALTGRFTRGIEQALGLSRFRIDPLVLQGEADPTARVTVGKEVARDLTLVYSVDLGTTEEEIYQVQWEASRKFRLTAERHASGGVGGGVNYQDRYWLGNRRVDEEADADPAREKAGPPPGGLASREGQIVEAIRFEGELLGEGGRLRRLVPLDEGRPFRRSAFLEGAQALRRHYVEEGRIEAEVEPAVEDPEGDGRVLVLYRVRPGPRVEVEIEGVSSRQRRRLRKELEASWVTSLFHQDLYEESADTILEWFHRRGHYTADTSVEVDLSDPVHRVVFRVDPGPEVRVARVRLVGAEQVPEERVLRQMLTRQDTLLRDRTLDPSVLRDDVSAIRSLYLDQGHLDVRIEPPRIRLSADGDEAEVELRIVEGPRYTVSGVEVTGTAPVPPETIAAWTGIAAGDPYSPGHVRAAETAVRAKLDARGYPDARVRARGTPVDGARVAIRVEVEDGGLKRVARVEVVGERLTREKTVRRELLLEPGDTVSRDAILRSQLRLYKLGIFSNVRLDYRPIDPDRPEEQVLRVRVEDAPPIGVNLGAGYDTEEGFRGSFGVSHNNLWGYNRRLSFQARQSEIEKRLQLSAEEPRLFAQPLPTLFNILREETQETGYEVTRRAAALRVEDKFRPGWTRFVRYNYQRVSLSNVSDPIAALEEKLTNVKLGDLGLSIVNDRRDDPFSPTRGTLLTGEMRVFSPLFLSEANFLKGWVQGSWTRTASNGVQVAANARVGAAWPMGGTERVPLSERFFAGGDRTIRGFERDAVGPSVVDPESGRTVYLGGEALLVANQEVRVPLGWKGSLKGVLFYDAGTVWLTLDGVDLGEVRHVLGTGLRLETPIGPIRAEYGWKLDRKPDESAGELFISLGTAF